MKRTVLVTGANRGIGFQMVAFDVNRFHATIALLPCDGGTSQQSGGSGR